jgi:hypothetical protein
VTDSVLVDQLVLLLPPGKTDTIGTTSTVIVFTAWYVNERMLVSAAPTMQLAHVGDAMAEWARSDHRTARKAHTDGICPSEWKL